eukprot:Awhi_evm2s7873
MVKCSFEGCKVKYAVFNYIDKSDDYYCKKHKCDGMVDVKSPRCVEKDCLLRPAFNNPDQKKGMYCSTHKKKDMIDVKSPRCVEKDCLSQPAFNNPDQKKGLYCSTHKKKGMIDVKNSRCIEKDCLLRPLFNHPDQKKGLYCSKHKKKGMIDVVNKRCVEKDCLLRPAFNHPDQKKGLYCSTHKKKGMIDVKSPRCVEKDCLLRPYFNHPTEKKGLYCSKHKKKGMVDVKNPRCSNNCGKISTSFNGMCLNCYMFYNPTSSIARKHRAKELYIVQYLDTMYSSRYTLSFNKSVDGGCSAKRPDVLFDLGTHCIIFENDEGQHKGYDTTCEIDRLNSLTTDLGDRLIVYIRFNCDSYMDENGDTIRGIFSYDKEKDDLIVFEEERDERLIHLVEVIEEHIDYRPEWGDKLIENIYLFYDYNY